MKGNLLLCLLVLSFSVCPLTATDAKYFLYIGERCDPNTFYNSIATEGKVCITGSKCDPQTAICDCNNSEDGRWRSTWEEGECKLLPGSACLPGIDQEFYRCVNNAQCVRIRFGVYSCECDEGENCLNEKLSPPTVG